MDGKAGPSLRGTGRFGISNDSGKMTVSGPASLRLAANAPFEAKGIAASGKAEMSFLGDVEVVVAGSASGSALYTTYRYDYPTQAGICPVLSLGAEGKTVTLDSSGYGINNQGEPFPSRDGGSI